MKEHLLFSIAMIAIASIPNKLNAAPLPRNAGNEKWAAVRGQIVYGGDKAPEPMVFQRRNNQPPIWVSQWCVNSKNRGVKNVFVWISDGEKDRGIHMASKNIHPDLRNVPTEPVELTIVGNQFFPTSLGLRAGQKMVFKNTSNEATNLRVDRSLNFVNALVKPEDSHFVDDFKTDSIPVRMSSNLHPWMASHARVFDHPYFAVTDANGRFEIRNVRVGAMRLFVWHPEAGFLRDGVLANKGDPIEVKGRGLDVGKITIKPVD